MFEKTEKKVIGKILESNLNPSKMLIAVSGGLDSMVLLEILHKISQKFQIDLNAAHFHHGGDSKERNNALELVKEECELKKIPFYFGKAEKKLVSEDECRTQRLEFLKITKEETNCNIIVTAHHRDDLLETRLLRLIRGVGPLGLESIKVINLPFFRPFLKISRSEIELYKVRHLEDPTNSENIYSRNWVRNVWLKALENKFPGSKKTLSRSLELISSSKSFDLPGIEEKGLNRLTLSSLTLDQRHQVIANYVAKKNLKNYSLSHVHEIEKRLRKSDNKFSFVLAKKLWLVDTTHVYVSMK